MERGTTIGGRFRVLEASRSGGMAAVYRAEDTETGETVAVKVLRAAEGSYAARFEREADVLARLDHEAIVGYVAHGVTDDEERYLVMEWLEGEDLSSRLRRADLTIGEIARVVSRVADGIDVAHEAGVIHRDIKPANLFLPGGKTAQVKLIDFGIAALAGEDTLQSDPKLALGTPAYMAPEQARVGHAVDHRCDIYGLGCVLFRCLTGRRPFEGDTPIAVMTKVIMEEAPRVSSLRANVPTELDELVARMLAKDPDARPQAGVEIVAALAGLTHSNVVTRSLRPPSVPAIGSGELHLVSVVMSKADDHLAPALETTVRAFGAELARLAGGVFAVTLERVSGAATDQSLHAARCALALRSVLGEVPIALATGRGETDARLPVGEVIDRAARLLESERGHAIRIDSVTAGLVAGRMDVVVADAGVVLRGELPGADDVRTLLGSPTTCVGRIRELGYLEALYDETVGEPRANAVLVTADAGVGKSRLRVELATELRRREVRPEIWLGRGDPISAGAPFSLIAPVIRQAAGFAEADSSERKLTKLHAHAGRSSTAVFLAEMIGLGGHAGDETLAAARRDPIVMGDQMRRAWIDWLGARLERRPVVLILEDLHWGDRPSVAFVDEALRAFADRPLLVLALARPSVRDVFPELWKDRDVTKLQLRVLSRNASAALIEQVLGPETSQRVVDMLIQQSGGNAFYLEELIRAVAADPGRGELPDTVVAMAQARLEELPADARRVLRAASVFGKRFTLAQVEVLLGKSGRQGADRHLARLVEREVLTAEHKTRRVFAFRHDYLREAAYAMLTENDRVAGHKRAGTFLERKGRVDPLVLAEHFERGEDLDRARFWYQRAAEQALEANDFESAVARAENALRCGAEGGELGHIHFVLAQAQRWLGDHPATIAHGKAALERLSRDEAAWYSAAGLIANAAGNTADKTELIAVGNALAGAAPADEMIGAYIMALARTADRMLLSGRAEFAESILARLETVRDHSAAQEPAAAAWLHRIHAFQALFAGDPAAFTADMERAAEMFDRAGDLRNACLQRGNAGYGYLQVAAYDRAREALEAALATAERLGLANVITSVGADLGHTLLLQGEAERGAALLARAIRACREQGNPRIEAGARIYLAESRLAAGDVASAEADSVIAVDSAQASPPLRAVALAMVARVRIAQERADEALHEATRALAELEALGGTNEGEAQVRLTYALALRAAGDDGASRRAIVAARARLEQRAAAIADPAFRRSFLEQDPVHAETLRLAAAWNEAAG